MTSAPPRPIDRVYVSRLAVTRGHVGEASDTRLADDDVEYVLPGEHRTAVRELIATCRELIDEVYLGAERLEQALAAVEGE